MSGPLPLTFKNTVTGTIPMVLGFSSKTYLSADGNIMFVLTQDLNVYIYVTSDNWVTFTERPTIPVPSGTFEISPTADGSTFVWSTLSQPYIVTTTNNWVTSSQSNLVVGAFSGIRIIRISSNGLIAAFTDKNVTSSYICTRPNLVSSFTVAQTVVGAGANYGEAGSLSSDGSRFFVGNNSFGGSGIIYIYTSTNNWTTPPLIQSIVAPPTITNFPNTILSVNTDGSSFFSAAQQAGTGVGIFSYTTDDWATNGTGYITQPSSVLLTGGAIIANRPYAFPTVVTPPGGFPSYGELLMTDNNWSTYETLQTLSNATDPTHIPADFIAFGLTSISDNGLYLSILDVTNSAVYIYDLHIVGPVPPVPPRPPIPNPIIIVLPIDHGIVSGPPSDNQYNHVYVGNHNPILEAPQTDKHLNSIAVNVPNQQSMGWVPKDNAWNHLTFHLGVFR